MLPPIIKSFLFYSQDCMKQPPLLFSIICFTTWQAGMTKVIFILRQDAQLCTMQLWKNIINRPS